MINKNLLKFIKEARRRGFDDYEIRAPLIKHDWHIHEIDEAFASLKEPVKFKNKVCLYLDRDILLAIEKRAKKNMFNISEQIEDILRRSAVNLKKRRSNTEKLDDVLVSIFSRRKRRAK